MPASELPEQQLFSLRTPGLWVAADGGPEATRVTLDGELDFATRLTFEQAVRTLLRTGPPTLVVDLRDVSFLAVAGAHTIEDADRRCRQAGGGLVLVNPSRAGRRLLALFGLTELIADG